MKIQCRAFIASCLALPLVSAACASQAEMHARQYSHEVLRGGDTPVGSMSEHVIDMKASGYYMLQAKLRDAKGTLSEDLKVIPFQGILITALHAGKAKELARIWDPQSAMRGNLRLRYGEQNGLYDREMLAFYYWHQEPTPWPFSTSDTVQSYVFLGPTVFGKERMEDVTLEDAKKWFAYIDQHPTLRATLRYLGTAEVPCPPCWGNINYFEFLGLKLP
jgi:hypothetical protein